MAAIESSSSIINKGSLIKVDGQALDHSTCDFTNICTGFGVDHEVPVRVAVYALPVLQIGEQLIAAQTEYYIAQAFATKINNLDEKKVMCNVELIKEYISLLSKKLGVTKTPTWLAENDPFQPERSALLSEMVKILKASGSERILRFAESRNGDESLSYIAAHALYMWDKLDIDPQLFIIDRPQVPDSLLVIGGPSEKLFHEARQIILSSYPTTESRKTVQGFTEIGRRPPYYSAGGDLLITSNDQMNLDLNSILSIADSDALRDTLYLVISLSETLTFSDINRIKKGQLTSQELDDISVAVEKLQEIIGQLRS